MKLPLSPQSARFDLEPRLIDSGKDATALIGRYGEELAVRFLCKNRRYRLLARNWRSKRDEIDLVCLDRSVVVFVEVKTRSASATVSGIYSIDRRKKRALRRVCFAYLRELRPKVRSYRFDVIEVQIDRGEGVAEVRHFENVPLFYK